MYSQIKLSFTKFVTMFVLCCASIFTISSHASIVYVSELFSGKIIGVDSSGNKLPLSVVFGRPGPITFDKRGALYVYDYDKSGVYRISRKGDVSWYSSGPPSSASIFRNVVDITVTHSGKVLLLTHVQLESGTDREYSDVWILKRGHSPRFLASTQGYAAPGQNARGFTVGPDNRIYLAMQAGNPGQGATARVLVINHKGDVSTFYDSGVSQRSEGGADFIDVRFDSTGNMYLLVNLPSIPEQANPREIWKVVDGGASVLVPVGLLGSNALQMDIDNRDHLYISGGGFQSSNANGFLYDVDPSGNVSLLAEFPPFGGNSYNPIMDVAVAPRRR